MAFFTAECTKKDVSHAELAAKFEGLEHCPFCGSRLQTEVIEIADSPPPRRGPYPRTSPAPRGALALLQPLTSHYGAPLNRSFSPTPSETQSETPPSNLRSTFSGLATSHSIAQNARSKSIMKDGDDAPADLSATFGFDVHAGEFSTDSNAGISFPVWHKISHVVRSQPHRYLLRQSYPNVTKFLRTLFSGLHEVQNCDPSEFTIVGQVTNGVNPSVSRITNFNQNQPFTLKDLKVRAGVKKRISGQEATIINVLKEKEVDGPINGKGKGKGRGQGDHKPDSDTSTPASPRGPASKKRKTNTKASTQTEPKIKQEHGIKQEAGLLPAKKPPTKRTALTKNDLSTLNFLKGQGIDLTDDNITVQSALEQAAALDGGEDVEDSHGDSPSVQDNYSELGGDLLDAVKFDMGRSDIPTVAPAFVESADFMTGAGTLVTEPRPLAKKFRDLPVPMTTRGAARKRGSH